MRKTRFNPDHFHPNQIPMYLVLVPLAIFMAVPIVFIVNHAFKPIEELFAFPPRFLTPDFPNQTGSFFKHDFKRLFKGAMKLTVFQNYSSRLAEVVQGSFFPNKNVYRLDAVSFLSNSPLSLK